MNNNNSSAHDWLNEHGDYLYRFALARVRDAHQAEDIVQDTLLAAMQAPVFEGKSTSRTWLTGILKHKIIDAMRKQMRERPTENLGQSIASTLDTEGLPTDAGMDEFFDAEHGDHWSEKPQAWGIPEGELEKKQFLITLQNCMERLPAKLAQLFTLRDIQEEDNEKICKDLQITSTNAWVMLYRARMSLRKCLEINWLGNER